MKKSAFILVVICLHLTTLSCDRPAPLDDLDRQEEIPVEDTFEPVPTEIP